LLLASVNALTYESAGQDATQPEADRYSAPVVQLFVLAAHFPLVSVVNYGHVSRHLPLRVNFLPTAQVMSWHWLFLVS